jgi:glutaredoxin
MLPQTPQQKGYTIYSKSNCSFCVKAKKHFEFEPIEPLIINCDQYLETNRVGFLEFIQELAGREHKTFPMIFKDGIFIGGYEDSLNPT